jgi:hypothetical protein
MIHRVDTKDCIERIVIERQYGIGVCGFKRDSIGEIGPGHALSSGSDSCLIRVYTGDSTTCGAGQVPGGSAGATGDFQNVMLRLKIQPRYEAIVFVGCGPTVLADVLTERLLANCLKDLLSEMAVRAVEEINAFRHSDKPFDRQNVAGLANWQEPQVDRLRGEMVEWADANAFHQIFAFELWD